MRRLLPVFAFIFGVVLTTISAQAATIDVDLSTQTMHVSAADGNYDWPISSGRDGFGTPGGTYGVQRLEAMHRSHKYHNSPMPHSIFFHGGYAIHGTYETGSLGMPASHGCIRISPAHAAMLYGIVKHEGATISIAGSAGWQSRHYASARHRHGAHYAARRQRSDEALGYADMEGQRMPSMRAWMRSPVESSGYVYDPSDD